MSLIDRALRLGPGGPYLLQAAIAAEHARAPTPAETDWSRIASLYDLLRLAQPSPVIELNRAVAVAMAEGPERGLELLDHADLADGLSDYQWFWSSRGDLPHRDESLFLRLAGAGGQQLAVRGERHRPHARTT